MESLTLNEINHLSEYRELRFEDFDFPNIPEGSLPQFSKGGFLKISTKKVSSSWRPSCQSYQGVCAIYLHTGDRPNK